MTWVVFSKAADPDPADSSWNLYRLPQERPRRVYRRMIRRPRDDQYRPLSRELTVTIQVYKTSAICWNKFIPIYKEDLKITKDMIHWRFLFGSSSSFCLSPLKDSLPPFPNHWIVFSFAALQRPIPLFYMYVACAISIVFYHCHLFLSAQFCLPLSNCLLSDLSSEIHMPLNLIWKDASLHVLFNLIR